MDLIELKKKFDDFRKNKNSRAVRFPHYLWQEVSKQIKIHGRAKVQKTLNLRCDQIKIYLNQSLKSSLSFDCTNSSETKLNH